MARPPDGYCSLAEAARRLGISHASAAKRIERGTLPAIKRGGRWFVHRDNLDTDPDTIATNHDDNDDRESGTKPDGKTTEPDTRLIEALLAQVSDLQRRLDTQDRTIAALIARVPQPATALPAEIEMADYRADTSVTRSDGPQRAQPSESTAMTSEPVSVVTGWLRRLFGR